LKHTFTDEEVEKAKLIMERKPDYKVADIQRVIFKGYIYTAKLIDYIKES